MEEKFSTFKIEHAQRSENWYADALATLGSQIDFDGSCKKSPLLKYFKKGSRKGKDVKGIGRFPLRKPF